MSAVILQSQNVPMPPASDGATTGPSAAKANFKDFFDQAMESNHPQSPPNLSQVPANKKIDPPKSSRKSAQAATNTQTPALASVPTPVPARKNPDSSGLTTTTAAQPSGSDSHLPGPTQHPGNSDSAPATMTARQFQQTFAGIESNAGSTAPAAEASTVPKTASQEVANGNSASAAGKSNTDTSVNVPLTPQVPVQQPASTDAQLSLPAEKATTQAPANLPTATQPDVKATLAPAEADPLIQTVVTAQTATDESSQPEPTARGSSSGPISAVRDAHLQKAVSVMENLQLNVLSAATSQAGGALPEDSKGGNAPASPKSAPHLSPDSATGVRQKQAAVNLQTSGKDSGASNSTPAQTSDVTLQPALLPATPPASSAGNSSKNGQPGQDSSTRHPEATAGAVSAAASVSGNISSAATSVTAASASALAPAQATPANSAPAQSSALPQPAASHTAVAENLSAGIENLRNQGGGMVNSASMLQAQGKTEMRVALQTDTLGQVQLHAVLDSGRVGASIAVVNHEAHTLLTNNLPALQQALTDQNLRLDHLSVLNAPMSSGTNTGNSGGFQSGGQPQPRPDAPQWTLAQPDQASPVNNESSVADAITGRLSVRA